MDQFVGALTIVSIVIAIIGAVGGITAYVRGSYSKARIEALRGDNDDLRNRIDDLEDSAKRAVDREGKLEDRCLHLEEENKTLTALVTQRAEVAAVGIKLEEHHTDVVEKFNLLLEAVNVLIEAIRKSGSHDDA